MAVNVMTVEDVLHKNFNDTVEMYADDVQAMIKDMKDSGTIRGSLDDENTQEALTRLEEKYLILTTLILEKIGLQRCLCLFVWLLRE
jgi:UDP-N-acetylmuramate-alanine ligase